MTEKKLIQPGKWYAEYDESGRCTAAVYDVSYWRILGYESEAEYSEAVRVWIDSVHPDDRDRLNEHLSDCLERHPEGMDMDIEYRMMTRRGYRLFHDYGHCVRREDGSVIRCDGVVFDIQDTVDKELAHRELHENYKRMLALEDKLESLYDVDLETGAYEVHVKGKMYGDLTPLLVNNNDFFSDSAKNADLVIFPEDRDNVVSVINASHIRNTLTGSNSIDLYYRLLADGKPRWSRMRIIYKNEEKKNIIVGVFSAEEEIQSRDQAEQKRKEMMAKMAGGVSTYILDPDTGRFQIISQNEHLAANYHSDEDFSTSIGRYIDTDVYEQDRAAARVSLSIPEILSHLENEEEYVVRYRDISTGYPHWYEMRAVRLSENEILYGFSDKDMEIISQMVSEKLEDDYFALFYINLDTGLAQTLKRSRLYDTGDVGSFAPFTSMVQAFASAFEGETRESFEKISNIDYLKRRFAEEDKAVFYYRSRFTKEMRWVSVTEHVLSRQEDGTPSLFALGFSFLDGNASEKEEARLKLKESMDVVGGLASEYTALYYVNLDTDDYVPYHLSPKTEDIRNFYKKSPKFVDLAHSFAGSNLVHPEDREKLLRFYSSAGEVRESLKNKKRTTVTFRRNYGGKFLWTEISIIKCEKDPEEAKNVIVGFIEKDREVREQQMLKKIDQSRKLIENITASYNVAYVVNMTNDSFRQLRMDKNILGYGVNFNNFSEAKYFFINRVLHPADKEQLSQEVDYDIIRERLRKTNSYSVEYRALINGKTIWHRMNVTAIDNDEIALGFAMKDTEILKEHLEEKRYEEYFSLFVVDLDTEMIKVIKNESDYTSVPVGESAPYSPFIQELASHLDDEPREFFMKLSNLEYVKGELSEDDKRTYSYKDSRLKEEQWVDVTTYVLWRHEDGTPSMFTLGFGGVDAFATVRKELLNHLNENMEMIGGLAAEYHALYYFNIRKNIFKVYSLDTQKFPEVAGIVESGSNPMDTFRKFGMSGMVHPEDRHLFTDLTVESVIAKLVHSKRFSIRFRRNFGGEYLWTEMDVIKYGNVDETPNAIAVGFAERDAEIRSEETLRNCFEVLSSETAPDDAIDKILAASGEFYGACRCYIFEYENNNETIKNTYEWCANGVESVKSSLQNVPANEIDGWVREFKDRGAYCMNTLDDANAYETDKGRAILEMQGINSLIAVPLMNGDKIAGFIGIDNPTKAKKNADILKKVAAVAYSEILKRRQTELVMYESAKIFADAFLESYVSAYYVNLTDSSYVVLNCSEFIEKRYTKTADYFESISRYINECVYPDDRAKANEAVNPDYIRECIKTTAKYSVRMRDTSEDGLLWYRMDITRGADDDHVGIAFTDITEEVRLEQEQQRQREEQFALSDGLAREYHTVWLVDGFGEHRLHLFRSTGKKTVQKAVQRGLDEPTYDSTMIKYVLDSVHEDDRARVLEASRFSTVVRETPDIGTYVVSYKRYCDDLGNIDYHQMCFAKAVAGDGTVNYILAFRDADKMLREQISQQKQLEEALDAVTEEKKHFNFVRDLINSAQWSFRLNADDEITGAEYAGNILRILNVEMSPEPHAWEKFLHPDDSQWVLDSFWATIKDHSGRTPYDVTYRMIDKDGKTKWFRSAGMVMRNEDGTGEFFGIHINVTERVEKDRAQQQLLENARTAAEEANKSKTNFLFNMSHDIRTPMNAITGFTSMAIKHIDDKDKALDCLSKIQQSGSMLLSLINSVLEVSRIESGHATLDEQPGDIFFSFSNIETTMRELAESKDVDLTFDIQNIRDRYVYCDFSRCMRIFVNVISNAVKYTPGGGHVRVYCEQIDGVENGYGHYLYTISDTGIGMSEEFQKHVFEQFSRENTSTVSGIQGTGLGMAVVKSFVDLMGGTISVKSKQGEGTTFTIILPFKIQNGTEYTDPATGDVVSKSDKPKETHDEFSFESRKVLLVDDNELNREIAIEILEDEGLIVTDADDGTTAVEMLREKGPDYFDFILMDIQMPVMGGYEATKVIREMYPDKHIPIIALSANAFAEDRSASVAAGMDDHVAKPIDIRELFNALAKYL